MKFLVTFYITHISYGEFIKSIFDVVVGEESFDKYDAQDFINDHIYEIQELCDSGNIFDHVVLNISPYDGESQGIKLLKKIKGKLVFEDKVVKTETEVETEVKKIYESSWIDLSGKRYQVSFGGHNQFAEERLLEMGYSLEELLDYGYFYEFLQDLGWVRVLGWAGPSFVVPKNITPSQKQSIKEYCWANECDFPKEVKSDE